MKVSEMIAQLQNILDKQGDIETAIIDKDYGDTLIINSVKVGNMQDGFATGGPVAIIDSSLSASVI